MTQSNLPKWDDVATKKNEYEVGGGCKTAPRTETVWEVFSQEVRVRVRRMTVNGVSWQFHVNSNCRGGQRGMGQTNILDDFPEYLDVRCPTANDDLIQLLDAMVRKETKVGVVTSNRRFMPVSTYQGRVWENRGGRIYA